MNQWNQLAKKSLIDKTIENLKANGINAEFVENAKEAKQRVFEILPLGAEVMNMSSVTLDTTGISKEINESGKFNSVKNKLKSMDRETQGPEMRKLGGAPDWGVGSVHAVTEDGKVLIASNTGSQLPAYAYAASHVIWVVGAQKIVKNIEEGMRRIYEYDLPAESERLNKLLNMTKGSFVSKILIINREIKPGRITLIFVNEVLGF